MSDSIAKCLINVIEVLTECSTTEGDNQLSHSHYITNKEAEIELFEIKERLERLVNPE